MKKGKDIECGWKDLLKGVEVEPKGYSTAKQIAEKLNLSLSHTSVKLNNLRKEGKIKVKKAKTKEGQTCWFFKD